MYWCKLVVFGQSRCILAKVVVVRANWLYLGKVIVFGKSCSIQARCFYYVKVVVFGQSCCFLAKVVLIRSNWLYMGKIGSILVCSLYMVKVGCF